MDEENLDEGYKLLLSIKTDKEEHEEEIIKYLKTIKPKNFNNYKDETPCSLITKKQIKAIQGLLDLYNKEKEKNEELEKYRGLYENEMLGYIAGYEDGKHHRLTATAIVAEENKQKRLEQMIKQNYISKDKIREKIEKTQELIDYNNERKQLSDMVEKLEEQKDLLKELLEGE